MGIKLVYIVYSIIFFLPYLVIQTTTQMLQRNVPENMCIVNKFVINLEIHIPPGGTGKLDMKVIAEIMKQIENGFLQQLSRFPQSPLPPEIQFNRFIQSGQEVQFQSEQQSALRHHIPIISSEDSDLPDPPYQPTTDLSKTLKWGEADVQALLADYALHEYQCYDGVYIPGTSSSYRSNSVIVNGNGIKMADYLFILFLRLVAELKKGNGGWIQGNLI